MGFHKGKMTSVYPYSIIRSFFTALKIPYARNCFGQGPPGDCYRPRPSLKPFCRFPVSPNHIQIPDHDLLALWWSLVPAWACPNTLSPLPCSSASFTCCFSAFTPLTLTTLPSGREVCCAHTHLRGSLMDCHILPTDCKVHEGKSHVNLAHNLSPGPQKYPTQRRCSIFVELRDEYTEEKTLAPDSSLLLCHCLCCGPTQNSPAVTGPWP